MNGMNTQKLGMTIMMKTQKFNERIFKYSEVGYRNNLADQDKIRILTESWVEALPDSNWKSYRIRYSHYNKVKKKSLESYDLYYYEGHDHPEAWRNNRSGWNSLIITHDYFLTEPQIRNCRISMRDHKENPNIIQIILGVDYSWYYPENTSAIFWMTKENVDEFEPIIYKFKSIADQRFIEQS